jgi:putative peptidoglycan lipid II flippase
MARLVVPVSVAACLLAPVVMERLAFGRTTQGGGRLIGVALAGLSAGLLPYGAFMLFVRAYYALGEGRAPALVALGSAALGAVLMAVGGALASGDAKLAVMGSAHSAAYVAGAAVLGVALFRRLTPPPGGHPPAPGARRTAEPLIRPTESSPRPATGVAPGQAAR